MASSSFAGRHPVVTVLLVLVGLLVVGGGITYFATDHGREVAKAVLPTLEQPTLNISNITREKIQAQFAVKLHNQAPIDLKIDSLRYRTSIDGKQIAQGHKDQPLVVKGNATSALSLPITLNLPELKQEIKTAQRDCVTVQLHTVLYADLPGLGPKEIPVDVRKRVYIPKLPKIEVADVDVTKLGLKKGEAIVKLRVTNFESIPFTVKQVNYRFQIEDDLDVKGQETKDVTFKKKGTEIMPIHVSFQPKSMPKVLFKTLFKAKKTDYKLTGSATVAAGPASAKDATMQFNSTGTVKDLKELAKAAKKD
jgi:LEA14-like dessication related protein